MVSSLPAGVSLRPPGRIAVPSGFIPAGMRASSVTAPSVQFDLKGAGSWLHAAHRTVEQATRASVRTLPAKHPPGALTSDARQRS